jgi:hypothetical protein
MRNQICKFAHFEPSDHFFTRVLQARIFWVIYTIIEFYISSQVNNYSGVAELVMSVLTFIQQESDRCETMRNHNLRSIILLLFNSVNKISLFLLLTRPHGGSSCSFAFLWTWRVMISFVGMNPTDFQMSTSMSNLQHEYDPVAKIRAVELIKTKV